MTDMEKAIVNEIEYVLENEFEDYKITEEQKKCVRNRIIERAYQYIDKIVTEEIEEFKEKNKEESE